MWQRRNGKGNGRRQRDLASLIDVYLLRCKVEGKSPHTLKAYGETLGRFARIAQEEAFPGDISQITPAHLYAYLGRYTIYSMETRHRYFREVRCFFNWLVETDCLKESPFRSLRNVRLPQKIVQPFSPHEVARLLAFCDSDTSIGARDRAILLTLLDTGVRCSELVQLDLDDLDLDAGRLQILHGKGNKQRVVPFASRCREAVLAFTLGAMGSRAHNFYNAAFKRAGYEDVAVEVQDLWLDGKREEAAARIPDEMVLKTNLLGTDAMVKDRIRAYRDAGVTTLRVDPDGEGLRERLTTLGRLADLVRTVNAE